MGQQYGSNGGGRAAQPFGFIGYQMGEVDGLYYVQLRSYDAGTGCFISEDKISRAITVPYTLNYYGYCWNRLLDLVDLNGVQGRDRQP